MKKIIYLLAFFAALVPANPFYAQSVISVRAPEYFKTIAASQPTELFVQPYTTGCYLITAAELAALTGSNITSFGIHLFIGNVYSVASGTIDVYLQNTNDLNYSKGTYFPSCISGMSNVYSGTTSIAAVTATTDVTCPLASPFTYTGGGLYVAFSWTAGTTSNIALYSFGAAANSFGVNKGQSSSTPALNTMTTTAYRPTFVFGLTNTAINEAGVEGISAPGRVADAVETDQVVKAYVKNISVNPLSNVQVSLTISGVNNFSDMQVVPAIAPGAVAMVTFNPYSPSSLGSQTITVTIPTDQNPANNIKVMTQSLTCNQAGIGPPVNDYFEPVAFQGILAGKFNFRRVATMKTVRMAISSTGINDVVHGVLLDNSGVVLARTNTITITNGMPYTFQSFSFTPTQTLQANTDYYIGMALPINNLSTMGCMRIADGAPDVSFGILPLAGGTFSLGRPAYYGIEPVLNGSITVSPGTSVICQGETLTLTPSGAATYTWINAAGNTIPSLPNGNLEAAPVNNELYVIMGANLAGCAVQQATKSLQSAICTGIAETEADAGLQLYPNPVINGHITLSGLRPDSSVTIYSIFGSELFTTTGLGETETIALPDLPAGYYFLKATSSTGYTKLLKFVNRN